MGSTHLNPNEMQISNAYKFRQEMKAYGFTELAIAGMLGNIQTESAISPGAIEKWSIFPNNAEELSDVPNDVVLNTNYNHSNHNAKGYAVGLIQWDTYTPNEPPGCMLASFAIRHNMTWYDGSTQTLRLYVEWRDNLSWTSYQWDGIKWTWDKFKNIEGHSPRIAVDIFRSCREKSAINQEGFQHRRDNGEFWYQYFQDHPDPPDPPGPDPDPDPPIPPEPGEFPLWLLFKFRERKLLKNVRFRS